MEQIKVTLMGPPFVEYGGIPVSFPYKKAEGLFYYLCVKQKITRNEAVDLFWPDCGEQTAKKNFRNAIYNIRRIFGNDILLAEGITWVELNRQRDIAVDLETISDESLLDKEFLQFFYVKDSCEFEHWTEEMRRRLRDKYIRALGHRIVRCKGKKDREFLEKSGYRLLREQIWEESLHRHVMEKLAEIGCYQSAAEQYQRLSKELEDSLGVSPEKETASLYRKILQMKNRMESLEQEETVFFYGRKEYLYHMFSRIDSEKGNASIPRASSFLITGEAGVGKTMLMEQLRKILEEAGHVTIFWTCWEQELYLRPWQGVLLAMEEYCRDKNIMSGSVSESLCKREQEDFPVFMSRFEALIESFFQTVGSRLAGRKVVLFFDELQWMDAMSLRVLSNLIFRMGTCLRVVAGCRSDFLEDMNHVRIPLIGNGLLEEVEMQPFTREEAREIVGEYRTGKESRKEADILYERTLGNPLFFMGLLNGKDEARLSADIKSRLIYLDEREEMILQTLSVKPDGVSLEELSLAFPRWSLDMAAGVERLIRRGLVQETGEERESYIRIRHPLVQEYLEKHLSAARKRLLAKQVHRE